MIAASRDRLARRNPFGFTHTTTAIPGLTFHNSRFVADAAVRHRFALQSLQARTNVTSPPAFQCAAAFHDIRPTRYALPSGKVNKKTYRPSVSPRRLRCLMRNDKDFFLEYHNRCQANSIL